MKKVLSLALAFAMLISCFALSTSAMAKDAPEIKVGGSVEVTYPKNGSDENSPLVAKFIPDATGYYEFECDKPYTNTSSKKDEVPGGVFAVDLHEEDYTATQGMTFFLDPSKMSDEDRAQFESIGFNLAEANHLITAALCEKGKTYYVTGYQDGAEDYTATLTVRTHTHTIKKNNVEKVTVDKNGTSDSFGGIYDTCDCGYCNYLEYSEFYKQIEKTTVKNAVYTGKKVTPTVKIITADGKKLNKKYYSVTYKNNKKIGKGKAVIKFKNGYKGTVTKTFKINPKATEIKSVTAGKKKLAVKAKKVSGITGYQFQVATNKKFTKNKKTATVKGKAKTAKTIKGLKAGKKYYVRVRTYKVVSGKKYYSAWTKVKTKTVKK